MADAEEPTPESTPKPSPEVLMLIHEIKKGTLNASYEISVKSLQLFKGMIESETWTTAQELMDSIKGQARIFVGAMPHESVTANVARRILRIIRDEYKAAEMNQTDDSQGVLSLHKIVTQTSEVDRTGDYSKHHASLRKALLEHLAEDETELETSGENLASQASEHIHSSEIILTIGHSRSVEKFLLHAATQRKFEVIVAECAPALRGHELAANLAKAKIQTTVIPDSAIYAIMSRVNKVIIGTHCVLANGGLRATSGSYTVACAADHYSVPVVVLVPMFKISPVHECSLQQDCFNLMGNPAYVVPFTSSASRFTTIYNPIFDYVPAEMLTLFISNAGGNSPQYIYRLLTELYHPDDYVL